jgi:hypothetical protein
MMEGGYVLAGALTGLMVSLTGVGGGSMMTPILLLVFGIAPATAVATDLWFAAITKMVAIPIGGGMKQVDWPVVRRLWGGSLPVAAGVVVLVGIGLKMHRSGWLTQAIGIAVLITAAGLLLGPSFMAKVRQRPSEPASTIRAWQPGLTVLSGAFLGLCVALTSVGAGALGCVMLVYLYPQRMTPHRLVATDIMHAIPLTVVAGLGYLFAGQVNGPVLASLLTGSVPAVVVGRLIAGKCHARWLQLALAVMLLVTGIKTLV